jgi:sulfite exporter TauE/SafE
MGHASGVLAVAALAFGLRQVVHLEALAGWGERLVGATLIVLGLWGLRSLFRTRLHAHPAPSRRRRPRPLPRPPSGRGARRPPRPRAYPRGLLGGDAARPGGNGASGGDLPSLALPSASQTAGYLVAFAVGTLVAMTAFAWVIGWLSQRGLGVYRWTLGAASVLCALTGVAWIVLPLLGIALP